MVFKYFKQVFRYQFQTHNFDGFLFSIHHTNQCFECLTYSFKNQAFFHL